LELEKGIVPSILDIGTNGRELLIGGHKRRSDIVCEQQGVSDDVLELNDIVVSYDSTSTSFWDLLGG
jgi:hypothetical protein